MGERLVNRVEVPELNKLADLPVQEDGNTQTRVIELGWARQVEEAKKRDEHWTEVDLFLEMWDRVARSWGNDTLKRLARYARLEAETEREMERRSR